MSRWAPRAASRRLALQVLYAVDVTGGARPGGAPRPFPMADEIFEEVARHFDLAEGARVFAKELVAGVMAERSWTGATQKTSRIVLERYIFFSKIITVNDY